MGADAIKQETHVATVVPGVGELASAREAAKNAQRPMQENRIAHEDSLVRATEVKAPIVSDIVYLRFLCSHFRACASQVPSMSCVKIGPSRKNC